MPDPRISRRHLLTGRPAPPRFRPRPPGVSAETLSACTGCGRCVAACPEGIVTLAGDRVALAFAGGECTFCGRCADACPEPVFGSVPAMAHRVALTDACLVHAGITCMTCRDACPETAIRVRPRRGGPFLPVLDPELCTGCGACIAPCPADAIHPVEKEPEDA